MPEDEESYEIIPVTPLKKLEQRIEKIEESGTIPQLQALITQIIDLIRSNQKIVSDVIQANTELRNELSKIPSKIDELVVSLKNFISLVEAAGKEEIAPPTTEGFKPLIEQFQKMIEQNQKLLESNEAMINKLDSIEKKIRGGTPVSRILSSYPGVRLRREVSK